MEENPHLAQPVRSSGKFDTKPGHFAYTKYSVYVKEKKMVPELSVRLSNAIEGIRRKKKFKGDVIMVEKELREKSTRLASLSALLAKEEVDVQKLERTSLTTLFYSVLGSREEKLEKERQELLSVQLQYQQIKHQVAYLERELAYNREQLDKLENVEAEYEALLSEKEKLLRGADQEVNSQLIAYAEQSGGLVSRLKELSEAIRAGKDVLAGLEGILASLESARNWGTWDMLGGGLISTIAKHNRIDDARDGIHEVQARLSSFERELSDVREQIELGIDIGEFETFADYFFDSLIFDWAVQSKINASLERTLNAKDVLTGVLEELETLERNAQNELSDLVEKRA